MSRRNIALALGLALAVPVLAVALFGQSLALRNPTDFNYIAQIDGRFLAPPFPAFRSAEFPLGSDPFGRDTLSRLLWALRPTLLLALGIALLRVGLGSLIGVAAGWSTGRAASALNALTRAALSVPVFLIALMVIAVMQTQFGAVAFVLGLALTGWAEVAQFCANQTRVLKTERFIEAARALGAPGWQIALKHVWRQLTPALRLFLVLETGGVLLTVASLGFLGYFAGGANWIMVTDYEAQRLAGVPELAEMLASAVQSRNTEQMLIVGVTMVALVLCFNLLGEGLRRQLALERRNRGAAERAVTDFVQSQQDRLSEALAGRRSRLRIAAGAAMLALAVSGAFAAQALTANQTQPPLSITGGHVWAGARRDAAGSLRGSGQLSAGAPHVDWERQLPGRLSGGPAVGRDGVIYVASSDKLLYALAPDGQTRWTAPLDELPAGGLGLSGQGDVLIADAEGGVTAFDATGARKWRAVIDAGRRALSSPVIDDAGNAYVALEGTLGSVSAEGALRWRARLPYAYFSPAPRVNDGFVFFKDMVFSARTGAVLVKESRDDLDQFITGADGRLYLLSQASLLLWQRDGDSAALARVAQLDWTKEFPGRNAADASVWFDGGIWLLINTGFTSTRVAWLDRGGAVRGSVALPFGSGSVVAIDERGTQYVCGALSNVKVRCDALPPNALESQWSLETSVEPFAGDAFDNPMVLGGALVGDKLVVATLTGKLFVIATN